MPTLDSSSYCNSDSTVTASKASSQVSWNHYQPNHLPDALKEDIDVLQKQLLAQGALRPDRSNSLRLAIELFTLALLSTAFLFLVGQSLWFLIPSSGFLALFYLRSSFYAHDLLHGQLVSSKAPKKAKYTALFMVSLVQGLSATWWRQKHGLHHYAPNAYRADSDSTPSSSNNSPSTKPLSTNTVSALTSEAKSFQPLDSDIDTMPFICWSRSFLTPQQQDSRWIQAYLRLQCYAFWPIITTLRFVWIVDSFKQAKRPEALFMVIHHLATFALGTAFVYFAAQQSLGFSALLSAAWLLTANFISGALLGTFALLSHSGMQIYEHATSSHGADSYAKVFKSTRNIHYHPLTFYLSGGLSHQIEHHLFSTLKRTHLPTVSAQIERICHKHGFEYQSVSVWKAIALLHRSLKV